MARYGFSWVIQTSLRQGAWLERREYQKQLITWAYDQTDFASALHLDPSKNFVNSHVPSIVEVKMEAVLRCLPFS